MYKKIKLLLFAVLCITTGSSQNLMLNGDFENYITDSPFITNAPPWQGWSSPDFCHINGTASNGSAPSNQWGTQYAQSGDGYAAFLCYSTFPSFPGIVNAREFMYGQVSSPLQNGKQYCMSFYVSLSDTFNYAINRIGAYFSTSPTNPIIGSYPYLTFYQPQVMADSTVFYDDKINWEKIEGVYAATGGEQYITFGNFYLDGNVDTLRLGPHFPPYTTGRETFYYFDNISLEEIKPADAGPSNVTILAGDSIQIGNNLDSGSVYTWSPNYFMNDTNAISPFVKPAITTTYYVYKEQCSVTTVDSITVHVSGVGIDESKNLRNLKIYPNPYSSETTITYHLQEKSDVSIEVFSAIGQKVETILNTSQPSGEYKYTFSAKEKGFDAGIYFVKITVNGKSTMKKIVEIK